MTANRILEIDGMETARGKCYPVVLKDGRKVYVPTKGIVNELPHALVLKGWCYKMVMNPQPRKNGKKGGKSA